MARIRSGARIKRDNRKDWDRLLKESQKSKRDHGRTVEIGVFADQESDLVTIASAHEFGATINHPGTKGGVNYGYRTRKAAEAGEVRFLKPGQGFMSLGTTKASGPYTITIPQRSFLRAAIDEYRKRISRFVGNEFRKFYLKKQSMKTTLDRIGIFGVGLVKLKIRKGPFVPLAPSTIRRKGSSKPLIDNGRMIGSITHRPGRGSK